MDTITSQDFKNHLLKKKMHWREISLNKYGFPKQNFKNIYPY